MGFDLYVSGQEANIFDICKVLFLDRVATFKCSLCSFLAVVKENCFEHIVSEHKDWRRSKKSENTFSKFNLYLL